MMLKKSLLALSLAAAVGTVSAADPVASKVTTAGKGLDSAGLALTDKVGTQLISTQGALSVVELKDVTFTITNVASVVANYDTLAKLIVKFEGATLSASSDAGLTYGDAGGKKVGKLTVAKTAYPDASTIEFTIGESTNVEEADTLTLSGVDMAVDGSDISVTITAVSSVAGVTIDSASATVARYIDEYVGVVAKGAGFDGVIDVSTARKKFTQGATTDSVTVTVVDQTVDHGDTSASLGKDDVTVTLKGDFSFLDANGDGAISAADGNSLTGTKAKDLQSTVQTGAAGGAYTFTVAVSGKVTIPAQSYTADVEVDYTNSLNKAATDTTSGINAGKWTLNGDKDDIAFMPFGSQYANSITVTNMSSLAGEITVTLTDGGKSVSAEVGVAAAKSVTQIGKEVAALAAANGMTQANVNVVVNATGTTVVGVYYSKADGDRVLTK